MQWQEQGFLVSDAGERLDIGVIHAFLRTSYWAKDVPRDVVVRSIAHSLCFGIYEESGGAQVGFARVITDRATMGYLADVFVLDA